ncbi:MAG: ammonia-forming cytochrome c nitrite reductase subunit c552, partial [Planctomycetota bacterium]
MRTLLGILLAAACLAAGNVGHDSIVPRHVGNVPHVVAQPLAGSGLPLEDDACAACHGEPDLWEADQMRLFIPREGLAEDVHFLGGVNCHDCHGGDPAVFDPGALHAQEDGFRTPLEETWNACARCHEEQALALGADVHAEAEEKAETGRDVPSDCRACHGPKAHGMLSVRAGRTGVFVDNQIRFCGSCHEKPLDEYWASAHGRGLEHSGLLVTAICSDCHGAHGVYPASDERSTLHPANVA